MTSYKVQVTFIMDSERVPTDLSMEGFIVDTIEDELPAKVIEVNFSKEV